MTHGYRYPVYPVTSCPPDDAAWESASRRRNCSRDAVKNRYICVPNQSKTSLLEFCYDEIRPMVQSGNCIELAGTGTLNQQKCSTFREGCPTDPYFSDLIYKNPACLQINTIDGCYVADPKCPNKTDRDSTLTPANTTAYPIPNTDESGSVWIAGAFIGTVVVILILVVLILLFLRRKHGHRRRSGGKSTHSTNLLLGTEEEDGHDENIEIPETSIGQKSSSSMTLKVCDLGVHPVTTDSTFYKETRAFMAVKDAIAKNNCVLIIGEPGRGKTAMMNEVAKSLIEDDYDIQEVFTFQDIKSCPDKRKIFLFDNAFGIFGCDISFIDILDNYRDMKTLLRSKYNKLIITCRLTVYRKIQQFNFPSVMNVVNLSDPSISLCCQERNNLLQQFCSYHQLLLPDVEQLAGCTNQSFPLLCTLLFEVDELRAHAADIFENPIASLLEFFDSLRQSRPITYICLVYCALQCPVHCPLNNPKNCSEKEKSVIRSCEKYCKGASMEMVQQEFDQIINKTAWLQEKRNTSTYIFKHTYVYEILAYHFGKSHPEDFLAFMACNYIAEKCLVRDETEQNVHKAKLYLLTDNESLKDRLFADIDDGEYVDVFTNECWKNDGFRETFVRSVREMASEDRVNTFFNSTLVKRRSYLIKKSDKNPKKYISLKSNDAGWFREKLLEDRTETVEGDYIYHEGKVKAISWVIGYGLHEVLAELVNNEEDNKRWISHAELTSNAEQLRLLMLAILSENQETLMIVLGNVNSCNINTSCFSLAKIDGDKCEEIYLNKYKRFTPLTTSCYKGVSSAIKTLVEKGADVNLRDQNGSCPLVLACRFGAYSDVEYLVNHQASVSCRSENDDSPLIAAIIGNDLEIVQFLLNKKANVNQSNTKGRTPLYYAAKGGSLDIVKLLVEANAAVNETDKFEKFPLYWIAQLGYFEIACYLIDHGAEVDQYNTKGKTPLYCAAKRGNLKIVKVLVENGAAINSTTTKNRTALYRTAKRGHFELCKFLLENKANVHKTDSEGYTALYWASKKGHFAIVELLLKHNASPNNQSDGGKTALYWAAQRGHLDIAKSLVEKGADVNIEDANSKSPLYCASKRGHKELVEFLLEHGADVNTRNNKNKSALFRASKRNHLHVVEVLIEKGADVNLSNNDGESPLYWAAKRSHLEVVGKLLSANANVNSCSNQQQTPLYWASQRSNLAVAKALVKSGADVNKAGKNNKSPLYCAAKRGCLPIVELLVEQGADVNTRNVKQQSALLRASKRNHKNVVTYLVNKNADVNLGDNHKETPLLWAAENGHYDVVMILCEKGSDVNAFNSEHKTPLYCAARNGYENIVQYLLGKGANSDIHDRHGHSPLSMAKEAEYDNIVQIISSAKYAAKTTF